jgi:hypothetical protein
MADGAQSRPTGPRNATWSVDETILLLDLYMRAPNAEEGHPAVVDLSNRLIRRAAEAGLPVAMSFRNPTGVAMKLKNLAQQDPVFRATGRVGLPHGNAHNERVWALYASDLDALAREVRRILDDMPAASAEAGPAIPTRGPPPSVGPCSSDIIDGATSLYVAGLVGDVYALLPQLRRSGGRQMLKIGRTNDAARRRAELNFGFPPGSVVTWSILFQFELSDAARAHRAEQALLGDCASRGWSVGGEFAVAPLTELLAMARAAGYAARD